MKFELIFISTNEIDEITFLNDEKLFEKFLIQDEKGNLALETCVLNSFEETIKLMDFLFQDNFDLNPNKGSNEKQLFNISKYKPFCISFSQLEDKYQAWIENSKRENTMDEYGILIGIIGYIKRNEDKEYLILRTEITS